MKEPNKQWLTVLYIYWLFQFLLIIIGVCAVILIVDAVFGRQTISEILLIISRFFSNV